MARHKKNELLEIVSQSIRECNWNVLYIGDVREHPFLLRVYRNDSEKGYLVRVYIWNLTHGGGPRRPQDEYRIQITGVKKFVRGQDEKTLILGWWEPGQVFAGFDFTKHSSTLGHSPSIQIREEALRKAYINGIAASDKGNGEIAVAFRPDLFIHYLENLEAIHNFGESLSDYKILEEVLEKPGQVNDLTIEKVSAARRVTISTINRKLRDASFKLRVLTAYGFECAFCGIQLKLVDAAHIVPVSHPDSSDDTSNGISLCALHHRAFDKSLVTFDEEYRVISSRRELEKPRKQGHDKEMPRFINDLRPIIKLPPALKDRPHVDFIRQANKIRGWI